MCCKPFSMLNDTCLIYLLLQPLVEEQRKEPKMADSGVCRHRRADSEAKLFDKLQLLI